MTVFNKGISLGRSGLQTGRQAHTSAAPLSTLSRMIAAAVLKTSHVSRLVFRVDWMAWYSTCFTWTIKYCYPYDACDTDPRELSERRRTGTMDSGLQASEEEHQAQ